MDTVLTLSAQSRTVFGKKIKALRKAGQIPAVLYGHGIKSVPLLIKRGDFEKIFQRAGISSLINLKIDNEKARKVLIHEPQKDPLTLKPIHIDFYQVKMTEKIETEIPLKFIGEAPAVKELGGTVLINRHDIDVKCLPDDLIHEVTIDISGLKVLEDVIKIVNLPVPKSIEILNDPEEVIVLITPPRSEEEMAELEAPVEEKIEEVEEVKEIKTAEEETEEVKETEIAEKTEENEQISP